MNTNPPFPFLAAVCLFFTSSATVQSALMAYDQTVTGNVIMGSDIANGGFAIDQENSSVELALRARVRFNESNQAENTYNSNGDGSYTFQAGLPPTGFGFAPGSTSTATWNFDWSINSSADGLGGSLSGLTYEIGMDFDPSAGTQFYTMDPINFTSPEFGDASIGNNSTTSANDSVAANEADYLTLISTQNLAQNSWNMEFFDDNTFTFDGNDEGEYTIYLEAFDGGNSVARSEILVTVIPEPSVFLMGSISIFVLIWIRRR